MTLSIKQPLTTAGTFPTSVDYPPEAAHLRKYAADVYGPTSISGAVRDLLAGKTVRYALCSSEAGSAPIVEHLVTVAVPEGITCVRFCGERDNDPLGSGSETLCGSVYTPGGAEALDPVEVGACLAAHLAVGAFRSSCAFFRVKV